MSKKNIHYLGNPKLKLPGVQVGFTGDQVLDFAKCQEDPIFFIENYCYITTHSGIALFKLYEYQKRLIRALMDNRKVVVRFPRQMGKSTTVAAFICWYVLFREAKTAVILANKQSIAKEIFGRIGFMYEQLPFWLQKGVKVWNRTSFELENDCRCMCAASSPSSVRGITADFILVDEYGHLGSNLAEEFTASVFPTISSRPGSKIAIVSTPKGLNHYHKLWMDAENGLNGFIPIFAPWQEHPVRDQEWADDQLKTLGELKFKQEVECNFLGSSSTLFSGVKLGNLVTRDPSFNKDCLKVYEEPKKGNSYVCVVDTSRGRHLDYSAFVIFDVTSLPYKVVATFKDNTISTLEYPFMVYNTVRQYNQAYCLIEVNDAGGEIANTMWHEYEYENVYMTDKERLSEASGYPGIRTTKKVKMIGCSVLKELVEKDQLEINSHDILQEMGVFIQKKNGSYGADDTQINDDLMTCLWLFAWMTKQPIFADITNTNIRSILAKRREEEILESLSPFGFISTGDDEYDNSVNEQQPRGFSIDDWMGNRYD